MPTRLSVNSSESASTTLIYTGQGGDDLVVATPIVVEILGGAARAFGYDEVASADDTHTTAVARLSLEDGTRLTVTDSLRADPRRRSPPRPLGRGQRDRHSGRPADRVLHGIRGQRRGRAGLAVLHPGDPVQPQRQRRRRGRGLSGHLRAGRPGRQERRAGRARPRSADRGHVHGRPPGPADLRHRRHAGAARRALLRPGNRYRLPRPGAGRWRAGGAARELSVRRGVQLQPGHRPQRLGGIHAEPRRRDRRRRVRVPGHPQPTT